METTSKFSSLGLSSDRIPLGLKRRKKPAVRNIIMASTKGTNYGGDYNYQAGKLVDESMIVLRMRIKEMKALEKSDDELPANWMEWEKRYYLHYDKDIYEAIGLLQNYLMSVRPSLGVGMMVLLMFSVAISSRVFLFQGLEIAKGIFAGFQV